MEAHEGPHRRVEVAQSVVVADAEGKAAYELKLAGGLVKVDWVGFRWGAPEVRLEDLKEGLDALRALRED